MTISFEPAMSTDVERYLSIPRTGALRTFDVVNRLLQSAKPFFCARTALTVRARASPMCGHISEPSFLDRRSSRHSMSAAQLALAFYGLRRALRAMRRLGGSLFLERDQAMPQGPRAWSRGFRCRNDVSTRRAPTPHFSSTSIVVVRPTALGGSRGCEGPRPVLSARSAKRLRVSRRGRSAFDRWAPTSSRLLSFEGRRSWRNSFEFLRATSTFATVKGIET